MEVYVNGCKKYQVFKLFALTDGAVNRDMSAEKLNKIKQLLRK